ncbi:MAG TPA: hypothetical protein VHK64_09025 [Nocardioidaceae bacterium]|nr:hypothetical protein [Nocardioidaceae bacterium]
MPQELRSIQKLGMNAHLTSATAVAENAPVEGGLLAAQPVEAAAVVGTLELSVTKTGGPVATFAEVGSSGIDDQVFNDHELDPGPARKPLLQGNFYTVVWRGAFVAPGTAILHVRATRANGTVIVQKDVPVTHPPTNSPFTIVVL